MKSINLTLPSRMSRTERAPGHIRELRRQKRFRSKPVPIELFEEEEAIPEDAFDYTDIAHRMALDAPENSDTQFYSAQHYVKHTSPDRRFPFRRFRFAHSNIINAHQALAHGPGTYCPREKNFDIIFQETVKGFDYEKSPYAIRQLKKILEGPEDRLFIEEELNELPDNDTTYKMDIEFETRLCCRFPTYLLRHHGWETFETAMGDLKLAHEKYRVYRAKLADARSDSKGGDMSKAVISEAEAFSRITEKVSTCALLALVSIFVGNARAIDSKMHFPGVKNNERLNFLMSAISGGVIKRCEVMDIIAGIHNIVLPYTFSFGESKFRIKKSLITRENYLWVKILYKPTPRAIELFRYGFLDPSDEILSWRDGPTVYDEFELADVRILLGLKLIPPKRTIVDRVRRNLEQDLITSPQNFSLKSMVSRLDNANPYEKIFDPLEMTCQIKFCYRFCSFCHTTEHDFDYCPKKRCATCDDTHSPARCPYTVGVAWMTEVYYEQEKDIYRQTDADYDQLFKSIVKKEARPEILVH